jgi:hypothetical protein
VTKKQSILCERLKQLGFAQEQQVKLYGEIFELVSDPIILGDHLVFVDAIEKRSGQLRRVRIPLTIVSMVNKEHVAA